MKYLKQMLWNFLRILKIFWKMKNSKSVMKIFISSIIEKHLALLLHTSASSILEIENFTYWYINFVYVITISWENNTYTTSASSFVSDPSWKAIPNDIYFFTNALVGEELITCVKKFTLIDMWKISNLWHQNSRYCCENLINFKIGN